MKNRNRTAILMAASLLAAAPAFAQTSPNSPVAAQKQHTDGDGPTTVGPASGAYREFSDPKGWDAAAQAWHKQHTDGEGPTTVGPASGAYKEFTDPKGWDASAQAWHKQHTDGNSPTTIGPASGAYKQ